MLKPSGTLRRGHRRGRSVSYPNGTFVDGHHLGKDTPGTPVAPVGGRCINDVRPQPIINRHSAYVQARVVRFSAALHTDCSSLESLSSLTYCYVEYIA
jgi:hypothetical protein